MKKPQKTKSRIYILSIAIAAAVLVLGTGVLHQAGFVRSGAYLVRGGTLVIEGARANSTVFIDNKRIGTIDEDGSRSFGAIKPGERTVIVAHPLAWPWIFDFEVGSSETRTLYPLQVTQEPQRVALTEQSDMYRHAAAQLDGYREPVRNQPLERGDHRIWIEGTVVFVQKNQDVYSVFSSIYPIRNVSWYAERADTLILAVHNDVFALDIRKSDVQNFQPIYSGTTPEAVSDPTDSSRVLLRDAENYFSIAL